MGCGASQQAKPPAGMPAPTPAPAPVEGKGESRPMAFSEEDPGMMRFRNIVRTRSKPGDLEDSSEKTETPAPSFGRSSTAPDRTTCEVKSLSYRKESENLEEKSLCPSPSTRADNIISHRKAGGVDGPKFERIHTFPARLAADKDAATTHFLQKIVHSHENSTLFGDLTSSHLNRLVRAMRRVDLQPGEYVIRQGDSDADCCYICGQGCQFEVLINGAHRRNLGEGEVFGEIALLYGAARTASVKANVTSHAWKLERSAFQQTARDLANESTDTLTSWLQSEFPFFRDAILKAVRPLALALRRMEVTAGEKLQTNSGMVYIVERGNLLPDSSVASGRVYAFLKNEEDSDHLRAEELGWRRQRQAFVQQQQDAVQVALGSAASPEVAATNGKDSDTKFTEVERPHWSDRSATLSEMSQASTESKLSLTNLSIEAHKTVCTADDSFATIRAGNQGASLLFLTVRQWSLLLTRMYRSSFDWEDLRHNSTFAMMTPADFKEFQRFFTKQRSYPKGATVVQEGAHSAEFYLLVDGTVSVAAQGGRPHAEHRGFFFGCGMDENMGATVETSTECLLAVCTVDATTPSAMVEQFAKLCNTSAPIIATAVKDRKLLACMDDLEHVADIGSGGYGTVVLMRHKLDSMPVAVKVLLRDVVVERQQCEHVMSERQLLTELRHPFIVELLATFKDSKRLFMAMEYIVGGELWSLLAVQGVLSLELTRFIIGSLTLATQHMHTRHFVYRDMKPENLMINADGYVKLIDFGFCKKLHDNERTFTACGTVEYMAPELIKLKGHSFEVDWWSIGVLLYECLHGHTPFSGKGTIEDDWDIIRNIVDMKYEIEFDGQLSEDAVQLLKGLLTHDVPARLDSPAIQRHSFFSELDWDALLNKRLTPPYVPTASNPFDTSNFEPEIDENLTGTKLLSMSVEKYPDPAEWDADF